MANQPAKNRRSIAEVNRTLRSVIEAETLEQYFWTSGVIQAFRKDKRGRCYFELVDENSSIRCTVPDRRQSDLPFKLENNLEVAVYGDVQYFQRWSRVEIVVRIIQLAAQADFVTPAIDRLRSAGLYPPQKRPPPKRIRRIGCITGPRSLAKGDFEATFYGIDEEIDLPPLNWRFSTLEDERATRSIADAIRSLDATTDIDAIAIVRGGGDQEAFAAFDSFEVAQAISRCQTFVVSGIGHHRDQTLSDQVADHVAATPTAAAHFLASLCLRSADRFPPDAPGWPVAAEADYPPHAPSWSAAGEADYPPHAPTWSAAAEADYPPDAQVQPVAAASEIQPAKSNRVLNALVIIASVIVIVACVLVLGYLLLGTPL